ncbi:hypothetical protein L2E82_36351 [Cichorium intybus]|uniref:Uncharacterized protein n=1 Tax=Cichorium intybus TaxID=13427 RepID=A0ACB9BRH6_CICIN|nr:hypothetical protein L2E82_36351 [Cichorium intybus]
MSPYANKGARSNESKPFSAAKNTLQFLGNLALLNRGFGASVEVEETGYFRELNSVVITSISIDVNLLLIGSHKKQKGKGDMMTAFLIGYSKIKGVQLLLKRSSLCGIDTSSKDSEKPSKLSGKSKSPPSKIVEKTACDKSSHEPSHLLEGGVKKKRKFLCLMTSICHLCGT